MSSEQPTVTAVALPATTLRLLVASIFVAVGVMTAMLALEIVIVIQIFDLNDLVERLIPPGF